MKAENCVLKAAVAVTNTGKRDSEEIVQCYIRDMAAARVRPVKQLKDFRKIAVRAGECVTVMFEIPFDSLGYYDWDMNYRVDGGEYRVMIGGSSADVLEAGIVLEK